MDVVRPQPTERASFSVRRFGRPLLHALALLGLLAGIYIALAHLSADPLADVRAYYDAGARLNAGLPLYPAGADTNVADFYRYPPLLAIVFRPLALLPYTPVAILWGVAMALAFVLTIRHLGFRSRTFVVVGLLALPIGWALSIGQAQVLITLLTTLGTPAAIALAANIKLFPALVGVYWLGRREWRQLARLIAWGIAILALQLVLEPRGTLVYLGFPNLDQVGDVNNISPYAISPILWAVLVAGGLLLSLRLANGRWGWAAAVCLSVLATPRLLSYQLMTLLAALRAPDENGSRAITPPRQTARPAQPGDAPGR